MLKLAIWFLYFHIHSNKVVEKVSRVINFFPAEQQNFITHIFANVILGIISQILMSRREGGREPAMEILVGTTAIKNFIRKNKFYQIPSLVQTEIELRMQTLDQSLIKLSQQVVINREILFEYCIDEKLSGVF
ncbi:MAG: type IV pilus twitching motility protein PilT [candidate division WOR-3 bacterium]|nr:type IV pilus twitching motility protein PilT [candidate division WOR-3 bacterium]MCX7836544.1 type IV pilus twitching motility protein PilT [candidate division WOR-3 bacterium]MDW8113889.1 hypothetical protein [candidate division WOR-3 bacterium]